MTTQIRKNPRPRYDEGCLGAHALNVIGDRWALLVVRELMFAPKRFQMIRAGLPGVTASVLTQRLHQLAGGGIVTHDGDRYALTPVGRALHPLLIELCRWALLLPGHDPRRFISITALMISISATVDPARAAGLGLRAGFRDGHEGFDVTLDAQGRPQVRATRQVGGDFLLEGSGNDLAMALYGPLPVAGLAAAGQLALHGDTAAAQKFVDLFSLAPQTGCQIGSQTRSSSESPEVTAQTPGLSST